MTAQAQEVPNTRIAQIYGMAADPSGEALLYLATERGFFVVGPSGLAQQLSPGTQKFTGFAAHPRESGTFFAAGDATGGTADTQLMGQDFGRLGSRRRTRPAAGISGSGFVRGRPQEDGRGL